MAAEDHIPEDFSEDDVDEYFSVSCKYCHKDGLIWKTLNGSYRLVDKDTNALHTCSSYAKKQNKSKETRNPI